MADLIITNGDVAGELLRRTLRGPEVLPWRDVLHDGPVPMTNTLAELTDVRVRHLAGSGGGDFGAIEFELTSRDRGLGISGEFDNVIIWFEHDLYDQLQLLQVIDWFAAHPIAPGKLLLVQVDDYIGGQEPDAIVDQRASARPVSQAQLDLAVKAWRAFRQNTPAAWAGLLTEDLNALPFLRGAVVRMLEELPGPDGLSRTERQILECLHEDPTLTAIGLFAKVQKYEEAEFMGDWIFWRILNGLVIGPNPLVAGINGAPLQFDDRDRMKAYLTSQPALTTLGKSVLSGNADWAENHPVDRWWGGTHLARDTLWRWDPETSRLIPPA